MATTTTVLALIKQVGKKWKDLGLLKNPCPFPTCHEKAQNRDMAYCHRNKHSADNLPVCPGFGADQEPLPSPEAGVIHAVLLERM